MTTTPPYQTSTTAPLTTFTTLRSCSLCTCQNPTDFSPTTAQLLSCILCTRIFCPLHKSPTFSEQTCAADHVEYYNSRLAQLRQEMASNLDHSSNNSELEIEVDARGVLRRKGVFPSLEERERAVWMDETAELLNAATKLPMKKNSVRSPLLETKSFIGADIAV